MKKQIRIIFLIGTFIIYVSNIVIAQQFTEVSNLTGIGQGSVTLGDYDNDGKIDIVLSGLTGFSQATILYHNNGDNTFTETGIPFTGVYNSSASWGDCDNDGDLDLLITGTTAFTLDALSKLYRNDGGIFTEIATGLPGIYRSCVSWGDVDRDGDLDILTTGMATTAERVSRIYLNNGTGAFTEMPGTSFLPVFKGWSSFGDIDNDGYPDVVVTGETATLSKVAKLYHNNKDGSFIEITSSKLAGLAFGSGAWGDFNSDGYLDLIMCGEDAGFALFTKVYINNKIGGLTEQTGGTIPGVKNATISTGDYDNDGDIDVFLSGDRNNTATSEIYTNNGSGIFTKNSSISITGTNESSSGFCDFDNDGDLDLLVAGMDNNDNLITKIYKNNNSTANILPAKPLNLGYTIDKTVATFTWDRVAGDETSVNSLSYNVTIGLSAITSEVVSPQGDNVTGKRKIVSMGNTRLSNKLELNNLIWNTDYFASVQAIDNSFAGGPFSDPVTFKVTPKQPTKLIGSNMSTTSILLKWQRGNGNRCILFAKEGTSVPASPVNNTTYFANSYFGDGSPLGSTGWYCIYKGTADSVLLTGLNPAKDYTVHAIEFQGPNGSETYSTEINPGNDNIGVFSPGIFTVLSGISMTGLGAGSVKWGDYNNDGYLDILSTGQQVGGTNVSKIYKNNGNNTFTEQTSISITGVADGSSAWGDYNNDDLLDLVISGYNQSLGAITRIYKNNGDNTFTWQENISLTGVAYGSVAWADYDNDGDVDLLITGQNLNTGLVSTIYRNDGNNTFSEQTNINLKPVYRSSVAWGDYNNDGLLDILLTGQVGIESFAKNFSAIYKNNGNGTFSEQTEINLTDVCLSSVAWGDFNNDDYLDILLTGASGVPPDYRPITKVYQNTGNNTFTEISGSSLIGIAMSSAEWGDYNNDGLLDVLLTGYSENNLEFRIYLNNGKNGFFDLTALKIPGAYYCNTSSADYDSDGDLDVLFTGNTGTFTSQIYRNNLYMMAGEIKPNVRPEAPSNLQSEVNPGSLKLSWKGIETDETWFVNMSYNVRAKRSTDDNWKIASHSTSDGYRSINALGNTQLNRNLTILNPEAGTYLWQVQAVDQSYAGSVWSSVATVVIKNTQAYFKTDTVCLGYSTQFTDQSVVTDGIASWKWDFRDGTASIVQNPVHTYALAGTYAVKLLVTSTTGIKDSLTQNVIVKAKPGPAFTAPNICIGTPTQITNTTNLNGLTASKWAWSYGDGQSSAVQNPGTHNYALSGTYKAKLKTVTTNGCSDSIINDVIVAKYPETAISVSGEFVTVDGKLTFCDGLNLQLTSKSDPLYTYQWRKDENDLTGAEINTYTVTNSSGVYAARIINTLANCVSISESKTINIKPTPSKPVIVSDNYKTGDCLGESLVILRVDQASAGYTYKWLRNEVPLENSKSSSLEGFPEPGNFTVTAEQNGCYSKSNVFEITSQGAPDKPLLFARGPNVWYIGSNVISASQFKWYYNDNLIVGAKENYYVADQNLGTYFLRIANSAGCFSRSDYITIPTDKYLPPLKKSGDADPFAGLKIYPNPSPGIFTLEMDNELSGDLNISIITQGGKEILKIKFEKSVSHFSTQIDLSGQTKGAYFINIGLNNYSRTNQIIIR